MIYLSEPVRKAFAKRSADYFAFLYASRDNKVDPYAILAGEAHCPPALSKSMLTFLESDNLYHSMIPEPKPKMPWKSKDIYKTK